jgi:glycosyltransferase involved in cell wall biosynthesis
MPWNLKHSAIAWANIAPLLGAFAWTACKMARNADIVHAHWGVLGALASLLRPVHQRPVVVTVHGSDVTTGLMPIPQLTSWAIRHSDAVTTLSRAFLDHCVEVRGDDSQCHLIRHGIRSPSWSELERRRSDLRNGRPQPHLITVGRLVPERQHDLLIRAFGRVKRVHPEAVLTVVGGGSQAEPLAELAEALGLADDVRLMGRIPHSEVPEHLLAADLYISPTTIENFGTAVVEAAAHGLPVVTTDVGFPAKLVVDGEGGFIVPPTDGKALGAAILRALSSTAWLRKAGRFMRSRVDEFQLSWGRCAERFHSLYGSVASGSG